MSTPFVLITVRGGVAEYDVWGEAEVLRIDYDLLEEGGYTLDDIDWFIDSAQEIPDRAVRLYTMEALFKARIAAKGED